MRRLLGLLVLISGVVGLGYVALTGTAPRIQSSLGIEARAVADTAPLGVQARVWGRDVVLTGRVADQEERAALLAGVAAINGIRRVDAAQLQMLPVADPYRLTAARDMGGARSLSGVIPDDASRAILARVTSVHLAASLTLASGAPNADFATAAATGILAMDQMVEGDMVLSGANLTLTGLAADPAAADRVRAALNALPQGYTASTSIALRDDGTPLRLVLTRTEEGVTAAGKFPQAFPQAEVTDRFPQAGPLDITQAAVPSPDIGWPNMARISLGAAAALITAELTIEGATVSLTGQGAPAGIARAQALMAGLPDSFDVTTDLSVYDDGAPLVLTVVWEGGTARASGKYPSGFTPVAPRGGALTDTGEASFLPDDAGAFARNAAAGTAALALLQDGTLTSTASAITLTGTATSPRVTTDVAARLDGAAEGTAISQSLTYLDDGSPAAWSLTFDAASGAVLSGRLPTTLTPGRIATALGITPTGTPATAFEDSSSDTSLDTLTIAATYLPEIETLTYTRTATTGALDMILQPGVDVDQVAADLAERLPGDVAFTLSPLSALPESGTQRTNAATGRAEVFNNGFWLPAVDFIPTVSNCTAASDAVLAQEKITFFSGSAQLDATSIRAINALAAIVRPCVGAGLALEIGGHTDATGSAALNEALSNDRATAVRIALIDRGISDRTLASRGFGQTQPIADNATPEGRAANRRTTFTWTRP